MLNATPNMFQATVFVERTRCVSNSFCQRCWVHSKTQSNDSIIFHHGAMIFCDIRMRRKPQDLAYSSFVEKHIARLVTISKLLRVFKKSGLFDVTVRRKGCKSLKKMVVCSKRPDIIQRYRG